MSTDEAPAGRLIGGEHRLPIRVYFEDTDFSGAVYHGSYVRFLERGRSELIRHLGISHVSLDRDGLAFAVSEMKLRFRRAARIDDVVEVATAVENVTGARVDLAQTIRRDGETLVEANVTVALVERSGRPRRFPPALRDAFSALPSAD